eukprot:gene16056-17678_t
MPPKKKKGKSGKRKKSAKKSAKGNIPPLSEIISELNKEFYLIQIRDLEARLSRYQKKCDELELQNTEFKDNSDQQSLDKKEIVSFLKKQLEQRADEIADLQERLIGLQQAKDTEKDHYEVQLATLRTEMQEIKDQLTSENMVLGGKLASLEEFRVQKEDLLAKFAKLEEELVKQGDTHKEQMYNLEKKAVVDKDRLKKEMIVRVNTVASEFRKVSNKQMAETTKRTLRENVAINAQLSKMSDKTMELIQESDELKDKEKNQKLHLEMLEHNEKELMKKNSSNLKIIQMLTDKAKKQEKLIVDYRQKEAEFHKLEQEFTELKDEFSSLEGNFESEKTQKEKFLSHLSKREAEYENVLRDRMRLSKALSLCAQTIKKSLQSSPEHTSSSGLAQREALLHSLVDILDLAAEEGCGLAFEDIKPIFSEPQTQSHLSRLNSVINKSKHSAVAHYQIGNLGLVPGAKSMHLGATSGSHLNGTESLVLQQRKPAPDKARRGKASASEKLSVIDKQLVNNEKRTKLPAI